MKNKLSKRTLIFAAAIALTVCVAAGVSVAYIMTETDSLQNVFEPGEVDCLISETVSNNIKSAVTVENTGNVPAFIRVAVVANRVDGDGHIMAGAADISSALGASAMGSGWVKLGDYYYYSSPVDPEASTSNLLADSISLSGIQVTVMAEAIQAEPEDIAEEAWGVTVSGGTISGGGTGDE